MNLTRGFIALALLALPPASRADPRREQGTPSPVAAAELRQAALLRARRDLPAALASARAALEADAQCMRARLETGRLQRDTGDLEGAAATLLPLAERTRDGHPSTRRLAGYEAVHLLGRLQLDLGRADDCLHWLSWLNRHAPAEVLGQEYAQLYYDLAEARYRRGELGSMLACAEAGLSHCASRHGVGEAAMHPFRKRYAYQDTILWMDRAETAREEPETPLATTKAALSVWTNAKSAAVSNQMFSCLVPAWTSGRVAAFWADQPRVSVLDPVADTRAEVSLSLPGPVNLAAATDRGWLCQVEGELTLSHLGEDGKPLGTLELPAPATALVVCPLTRVVHLIAGGRCLTASLDRPGVQDRGVKAVGALALDPPRRRLYFALPTREDRDAEHEFMLRALLGAGVDSGRPVAQVALLQYTYEADSGFVMYRALRSHVAESPGRPVVSADGRQVAVAGGGHYSLDGWKPGLRPLSARDLADHPVVYPPLGDAPVLGADFHPVTGHLAIWSAQGLRVYPQGQTNQAFSAKARLGAAGVWSADGRALVLGGAAPEKAPAGAFRGLVALRMQLDAAAQSRGDARLVELAKAALPVTPPPPPAPAGQAAAAVPALAAFSPDGPEAAAPARLAKALALPAAPARPRWHETALYAAPENAPFRSEALNLLAQPAAEPAPLAHQARALVARAPGYAPAHYALGWALRASGDPRGALDAFQQAVRADQGRTDLSSLSLAWMGEILTGQKQRGPALHCLAAGLELDRSHEMTLDLLRPWRADLPAGVSFAPDPVPPPLYGYPRRFLPQRSGNEAVARFAAPSLVRLRTARGDKTGVFVSANGLVLTTASAVAPADQLLEATTHTLGESGLLVRSTVPARVAWLDERLDLALVRLHAPPGFAPALCFAPAPPADGQGLLRLRVPPSPGGEWLTTHECTSLSSVFNGRRIFFATAEPEGSSEGAPFLNGNGEIIGLLTRAPDQAEGSSALVGADLPEILGLIHSFGSR